MSKLELTYTETTAGEAMPACLAQRAENTDEFRKSYHTVTHVTDVIKAEVLARLNKKLLPKEESFALPGWAERHAKDIGYVKAMKEFLDLLP